MIIMLFEFEKIYESIVLKGIKAVMLRRLNLTAVKEK
jgi:hypothetical protein